VRSGHPRADAADPLNGDAHHVSARRVVHRWELHIGPKIGVREALQELRAAALLEACPPVHDEVLPQPGRLDLTPLEGQSDTRVAADVAELLLIGEVSGHNLVAVQADPDAGDLG
jgi:hypothetical protein